MPWEIFKDALRRSWRSAVYWGIGIGSFGLYAAVLLQDTAGLQTFVQGFSALPQNLLAVMGMPDITMLGTPEGFIGLLFFSYGTLMLAIYGVFSGIDITANDEELGAMNMILSAPLPRWRLVLEKAGAHVVLIGVIVVIGWVGLTIGLQLNENGRGIDSFRTLQTMLGLVPFVMIVMGVSAVFGALFRRRNVAGATAGVFVAASYLIDTLGSATGTDFGNSLRTLSVFYHFDGARGVLDGLNVAAAGLMAVVGVALVWLTVRLFERRDITG